MKNNPSIKFLRDALLRSPETGKRLKIYDVIPSKSTFFILCKNKAEKWKINVKITEQK